MFCSSLEFIGFFFLMAHTVSAHVEVLWQRKDWFLAEEPRPVTYRSAEPNSLCAENSLQAHLGFLSGQFPVAALMAAHRG